MINRSQSQTPLLVKLLLLPTSQRLRKLTGMVHNHPSGDPTPSSADVDMTRQIVEAVRPLRIAIHDHLVVGRDGVASFKALGLM